MVEDISVHCCKGSYTPSSAVVAVLPTTTTSTAVTLSCNDYQYHYIINNSITIVSNLVIGYVITYISITITTSLLYK